MPEFITLSTSDLLLIKKLQVLKSICLGNKSPGSTTSQSEAASGNDTQYLLVPIELPNPTPTQQAAKYTPELDNLAKSSCHTGSHENDSKAKVEKDKVIPDLNNAKVQPSLDNLNFSQDNIQSSSRNGVDKSSIENEKSNTGSNSHATPNSISKTVEKSENLLALNDADTVSIFSTEGKSSLDSESSGHTANLIHNSKVGSYTYQKFCQNLDVTNSSTLSALEYLVESTKKKDVQPFQPPASHLPKIVEPDMATLADGLKARAKAYQENPPSRNTQMGIDPAKSLELLSFGLGSSSENPNPQKSLSAFKPILDDYFLQKASPIVTDLSSSFPNKREFGEKENDLSNVSLTSPGLSKSYDQSPSIHSVSSNTILDYYYPDKPADTLGTFSRKNILPNQMTKNTVEHQDVNLQPIAAAADQSISQPGVSDPVPKFNTIQSVLLSSAARPLATAQKNVRLSNIPPTFNQTMFGPNGIPNSFHSESSIPSLTPMVLNSQSEHTGQLMYTDTPYPYYGSSYQSHTSQTNSSNNVSGNYTTGERGSMRDDLPPVYSNPSASSSHFSLSSSSSASADSFLEAGNNSQLQSPDRNQMSVSRRGSMWDTFDDPLMEGLIVQEIDGVGPDSWNDL